MFGERERSWKWSFPGLTFRFGLADMSVVLGGVGPFPDSNFFVAFLSETIFLSPKKFQLDRS